jgi:hypothetical protein
LDGAKIGTDGHSRFGRGPSAIALRQGSPVVINDYGDAPCTLPWRDRASRFGIQANAVLPITRSDRAVGVIALYSAQPQFFDQENMDLLSEHRPADHPPPWRPGLGPCRCGPGRKLQLHPARSLEPFKSS